MHINKHIQETPNSPDMSDAFTPEEIAGKVKILETFWKSVPNGNDNNFDRSVATTVVKDALNRGQMIYEVCGRAFDAPICPVMDLVDEW